jgi:hypothetical protein
VGGNGNSRWMMDGQWRRSGLKSGGTNPWRALEILKNDKIWGDNLLASPHCKFWGDSSPVPPVIYAHVDGNGNDRRKQIGAGMGMNERESEEWE